MATLVTDPVLETRLQANREASGADRYDEVWERVRMMAPMPNDEHQDIVTLLTSVLVDIVRWPELGEVRAGVNVSDRREDWQDNYRVPDVAVFLNNGKAVNLGTCWFGGPDFVIEIISPHDRTRDKIPFYAKVGVRELLLIDRNPWRLELYRQVEDQLICQETAKVDDGIVVSSATLPLTFRLVSGDNRSRIDVEHTADGKSWRV